MNYIPYTYLIKFTNPFTLESFFYYGSKYSVGRKDKNVANPLTLFIDYFTSSDNVQNLIKEFGLSCFKFEIRKTFNTAIEAITWESKVLKRLKVDRNPKWINGNCSMAPPIGMTSNKIWVSHDMLNISSLINKEKLDEYILLGYRKGMSKQSAFKKSQVKISKETREKMSNSSKGKSKPKFSDEHKRNIGLASKNRIITEETRKKISNSSKGENNSFYGKKHSKELIKQIADKIRGRKWMNDGIIRKTVKDDEIEYYLSLGFKFGKKF